MWNALAAAAWRRGAEVALVSGPTMRRQPYGVRLVEVETSDDMLEALAQALEAAHLLLMAAAVSDFTTSPRASKIKKSEEGLDLHLVAGPDLLEQTRAIRKRKGILTLGFALETDAPLENGRSKLEAKNLDFVAINEAGDPHGGFEAPTNRVTLLDRWGALEEFPVLSKEEVADRLLDRIETRLD